MRKSIATFILIVILLLVAGGIFLGLSHKSNKQTSTTMNMPSSTNQTSKQTPSTHQPASNTIEISNFAFNPADITVKTGTTLTWINKDSVTHTVTENDGQTGPNSGPLAPGKSYSFTFSTAGTFKYHCSIHPEMTGTVHITNTL